MNLCFDTDLIIEIENDLKDQITSIFEKLVLRPNFIQLCNYAKKHLQNRSTKE